MLQPLADIVKLAGKEMFRPHGAVPLLFAIAPAIDDLLGHPHPGDHPLRRRQDGVGLYGIDVSIGILYFFAFGSLSFYGLLLAGWSSGSKYSFLGAMRSAAQLISYEVSMGLSLLGVGDDDRLALAHARGQRPGPRSGTSSRSSSAS